MTPLLGIRLDLIAARGFPSPQHSRGVPVSPFKPNTLIQSSTIGLEE